MLSKTPEAATPADRPRPGPGAPTQARHSRAGATPATGGGRHRRTAAEPPVAAPSVADPSVADPSEARATRPREADASRPSEARAAGPGRDRQHTAQDEEHRQRHQRPTTLADSPLSYRAGARTDAIVRPRLPLPDDDTPRYRAARSRESLPRPADALPRPRATDTGAPPVPGGARARRRAAGRRRAQQDTAWDKAAAAVQAAHRATVELARRQRPAAAPGSHARAIVVSALPSARDAVAEQLPAVRRVAGAVREWALASEPTRPVTGTRRAPGTLPIESWLLIGRQRQQALLAALVAVGVMLVVIPTQRYSDAAPDASAGERSLVTIDHNRRVPAEQPVVVPEATAKAPQGTSAGRPAAPAGGRRSAPATSQPAAPAESGVPAKSAPGGSAPATSPAADAAAAYGPARSLRHTGSDTVALTFDDGPDPVQTPKLLELLAEHQVRATFCLVGKQARAHPEIVRQIVAAGHTLCNHSWDHSFTLGIQDAADIRRDLEATDQAIRDAVPDVAIPYFRAPGGIFTHRLVSVANSYGMKSLYWEVDPRDWDHTFDLNDARHVDRVVAEVKDNVRPGSIVLSHDFNQPQTIVAYEKLLPYLTEKYELGLP